MSYSLAFHPNCQKEILKACKKYSALKEALEKKIKEICDNPARFKPLKHEYQGKRRVHIMKSFVLLFSVEQNSRTVNLLAFKHHDEAYKR
jgi:YafQ family addiction module toxin component